MVRQSPPHALVESAIRRAQQSGCLRSQRAAVVWDPRLKNKAICWGNNYLPGADECDASDACKAVCGKRCVHAEASAIQVKRRGDLQGCAMLHVKVVDGDLVASGPPSCWQCSRMILDAGIWLMWLYHENGWKAYTAEEFHRETLKNCGIWPPGTAPEHSTPTGE